MNKYEFNPLTIPLLIGICLIPIGLILRFAFNTYFSLNIGYYEILIPIIASVPILTYFSSKRD